MKRFVMFFATLVFGVTIAIFLARLMFPLPDISDRGQARALGGDPETPLGRMMIAGGAAHPGQSGVIPLYNGHDALVSRLALVDAAVQSIDMQYYIWHGDTSGMLLLDALDRAAKRGVRVRLLLDDNGIHGLDPILAALNARENFQIRLFNPSPLRRPKMLGYAFDFFRMNRRMHNKSIVVDGAVSIIGGRNIGDEYFQLGDDIFFVDLDVLATGAIVPETAAVFDAYWNSQSVFELERIVTGPGDPAGFAARVAAVKDSTEAAQLQGAMQNSMERFASGGLTPEWAKVQLVADDPAKGQGIATRDQLMITRLGSILGRIEQKLDLVSAYFIPGQEGTRYFGDLARDGKTVRVLTNALNTTDVPMVHSGYTKYRRELLRAGATLYELKLRGEMTPEAGFQVNPLGFSGGSLHAKTFAVDDARVFIGSFNFDPRSAMLNCEMGFLIDSPTLAQGIGAIFDGPVATVSYRPELTPEDKMVWQEIRSDGTRVTYQEEPGATWFQQIMLVVMGLLPVEWML